MSFNKIREYFNDRIYEADSELREWEDAFNIDNIPSTILDKAYHLAYGTFSYLGAAHTCLRYDVPVTVSVCFKGYLNPKEAVDTALVYAEAITKALTDPLKRVAGPHVKNVLPVYARVRPISGSNDNVAILEMQFKTTIII